MKINNIKLGFSKSKYTHNLSRDCNTTFPFGVVQPIFTQYLLPNSTIKVSAKQLVRLAPMPVPSFARVSLRTVTRFVPEIDVVPYADAFYSRMPYRGKVPTTLPLISNAVLVYYLLSISNCIVYSVDGTGKFTPIDVISVELKQAFTRLFFKTACSEQFSFYNQIDDNNVSVYRPKPTPQNSDYVVYFDTAASTPTPRYCACFMFGSQAKNFRNICIGLGYSLDLDDLTPIRFSPLLSFYKAYYDTYGITRFKAFTETNCFNLITNFIDTMDVVDFSKPSSSSVALDVRLKNFFKDLSLCYYSVSQDIVSLHREKVETGSFPALFFPLVGTDNIAASIDVSANQYPTFDTSNNPWLTNVSLKSLSILSRFVSKNSILGKRLSDYMSLHYGSDVVSSIFKDSNFVDSSVLNCSINDVFSTSDTAQYDASTDTKTGENLGAFAGKGIGFGDLSFKYDASCHGYLITLASIVPNAGYWQGTSPDLFAVNWEQQPSADFDALGMEATPRSVFVSHNDISNRSKLKLDDLTDKSFGFVPRFTGFKFAKNTVNGDMSRRGTIDSMSPYYLDHIITSHQINTKAVGDDFHYTLSSSPVPSTSYDWRFVCKYPWLGNFLRLFINDVGPLDKGSYSAVAPVDYNLMCIDDSFLCQIAFKVNVSNCLKPISLSFDTYEENVDNASKNVDPS